MQQEKKYWEPSQESITDMVLAHAIKVNFRPPPVPLPMVSPQEAGEVIAM